ncbi:hypothetical protein [Salinibaculum rarum]|uniref:hypothetical protein n=1 Tax=Salinibaculum rarum TaxID=3058903 RepID=UPI00265D75D2|nr:hypothetical protein [Salinibaculum sp. KK48]
MSETTIAVDDLWIERVSRRLGFGAVSERLVGTDGWGPYLFIVTVILVHLPLLSLVGWTQTGVLSFTANPGEIFQVVAWPAAVWILLRTKQRYVETVRNLPAAIDEDVQDLDIEWRPTARLLTAVGVPANPSGKADAKLEEIAPDPIRYGILAVGLAVYGGVLLTNPANLVGPVADLTGPFVATVRFYFIIPFVLYPIGAEFLAVVIGTLVLLPFKIRRARLLDFSDPHGYAGLSPSGEAFKSVAVSYFILLTLFTVFQTVAVGTNPTDQFSVALLAGGLLVGLVLFFGPMLWLKSFTGAAKEAKIDALADRSRQVGTTDELFPYAEPDSMDDASQYTYNHIRMQRVESTSEFPFDTSMLQEVLFALLLPYVTSIAFDFLLQSAV